MLVLSRQLHESIVIGDDIIITVVDIRGDKCRVGITAPSGVRVDRFEVRERIEAERRMANARADDAARLGGGPIPTTSLPPARPDRGNAIRALLDSGRTVEQVAVSLGLSEEDVREAVKAANYEGFCQFCGRDIGAGHESGCPYYSPPK